MNHKRGLNFYDAFKIFRLTDLAVIGIDIALFWGLTRMNAPLDLAHMISFLAAVGFAFYLKSRWPANKNDRAFVGGWASALVAVFLALFLRGGLLALSIEQLMLPPAVAIVMPAVLGRAVIRIAAKLFFEPGRGGEPSHDIDPMLRIMALTAYALLLKLVYLGLPEILYEEGYYWNYAQHLDIGYFDHPPMVAWVVWFFTRLLGDTAFTVRLGPFVLWFVGAYYTFGLARNIFNRETAIQSVLLYAVLPYFFFTSFMLFPDSSLMVCWAGALYYIHAFLIEEKPWAFLGIGIFIGLGMLSKYSMSLLGFAALLFVMFDRPSRKWLVSWQLWLAIAISLVVFSPVIIWNARHEWASFLFQSASRATGSFEFELPNLIGATLLLITPTGLMAAWVVARSTSPFISDHQLPRENEKVKRAYWLFIVLTTVPLSVFVFFSLFRETKINWTGPIWLGLLPYMAHMMSAGMEKFKKKLPVFGPRPWIITVIITLLIYGAGLHYLVLGIPGIPYAKKLLGQGWPEVAQEVEQIVEEIEDRTGVRPLVVGMDKYRTSSYLAFYRGDSRRYTKGRRSNQGAQDTAGRHLFGRSSLMYRYWFPSTEQAGKTMVLVGYKPKHLTGSRVEQRIDRGGEVKELVVQRHGQTIRRIYCRVVEGYRPLNP